jgi:hypothetical protein
VKRNLIIVAVVMVITLIVYRILSGNQFGNLSIAPYFVSLATAFLDGRLDLSNPPSTYDLIQFDGKWFVAQQPLPAILMMPIITVRGSFSDVTFGILLGTINVGLCYLVLSRYSPWLSLAKRLLLTALFAFGTAHLFMSVLGTVWFLGQIAATMFVWFFNWSVITERYVLAGAALGAVMLGRPSNVPAGLFFVVGWWWLTATLNRDRITTLVLRFVPLFLAAGVVLAGYNVARFGSPIEFGYDHLNDAENIRERRLEYGQFHPVFFPDNLYIATVKPLELHPSCLTDETCGLFDADLKGAGLLWTSPALLILFAAWHGANVDKRRVTVLAIAASVALLPSLFYHNNGSAQFGYRFAIDAMPFLILLMAHGARRTPLWLLMILVFLSIGINVWGTLWFKTQLNL